MKEIEITMGELHDFFKIYPEEKGNLLIEGKDGWFEIDDSAITAPNSLYYNIELEDNIFAKCAPDHLFYNNEYIKCKDLSEGDFILTKTGYKKVVNNRISKDKMDLYDIQVRHSQNYYGNGILSHNSTISQVIIFGLYGKLEGKTLKDIPNRINKNAWVRITFFSNGEKYVIERGLEPNLFKISINSIPYDKAINKTLQEYLTDDVIQIPNYVFNNTISLSINDFKSFLKMGTKDKKAIIDKIFGFYIINEMKELLKNETKDIKDNLMRLNGEIDSLTKTLSKTQEELELLSKRIRYDSDDKISELEEKIEKFSALHKLHSSKIREFQSLQSSYNEQTRKSYEKLAKAKGSYKEITEKLKFYDKDKCPLCSSDFKGMFYESIKDELKKDQIDVQKQITDLEKSYKESISKEGELIKQKEELDSKGNKIIVNINTAKDELKKIKSGNVDNALNSLKKIAETTRKNMQESNEHKTSTEKKATFIKKIDTILGEKGIKQLAIKTILPALNAHIAELMLDLHLSYTVRFNEDFEAFISDMGEEISISTLSTGEMKKIDFIVLLSVLKLMKIRFSSINLLFLDEIFSSVDPDGIHTILTSLRKICDELGLNVFVINHSQMPSELFDYKIEAEKRNKFSDLKISSV